MAVPTQTRAMEYFNYDPETGLFTFKQRGKEEFRRKEDYTQHLSSVGTQAGSVSYDGYRKLHMDGAYYTAHRLAWLIVYGEWVEYPKFEIDHINGNPDDNRISNLRKATKSENQRNSSQRVTNTSGVHGVNWKPKYNSTPGDGRWVARIWNGPKHVYLGGFKDIREAAIARKAAERALGYTGTDREPSEHARRRVEKQKAFGKPEAKI